MVLAVLAMIFASQMMTSQRLILNEASTFLNKTADKGYLNTTDIDELYMAMNSHGMLMDVEVERLVYAPVYKDDQVVANYTKAESTEDLGIERNGVKKASEIQFNKNDLVRVRVKEIGMTTARKYLFSLIGIDTGSFEFTLAAPVQ
jgi:hypothetical protein